jgi:hypothetical protein
MVEANQVSQRFDEGAEERGRHRVRGKDENDVFAR